MIFFDIFNNSMCICWSNARVVYPKVVFAVSASCIILFVFYVLTFRHKLERRYNLDNLKVPTKRIQFLPMKKRAFDFRKVMYLVMLTAGR